MNLEDKVKLQISLLKGYGHFFKLTTAITKEAHNEAKQQIKQAFTYVASAVLIMSSLEKLDSSIRSFLNELNANGGLKEDEIIGIVKSINTFATVNLFDYVTDPFLIDTEFDIDVLMIQMDFILQYILLTMLMYEINFEEIYSELK